MERAVRPVRQSRLGLSLLEVILASGLLFSLMVVLLNLATTSLWGTKEGGERLAAEGYACSLLERFRHQPFAAVPQGLPLPQEPYQEDGTEFRGVVTIRPVEGAPPSLRQLDVTVTWSSTRGSRQLTLSSYVVPSLR